MKSIINGFMKDILQNGSKWGAVETTRTRTISFMLKIFKNAFLAADHKFTKRILSLLCVSSNYCGTKACPYLAHIF
jgi:hypothetical protein